MNPYITIITAAHNDSSTINDRFKSINSQTMSVEYIIIDEVTLDNSLELVRNISPRAHNLSEPNNGTYDAIKVIGALPHWRDTVSQARLRFGQLLVEERGLNSALEKLEEMLVLSRIYA